MRICLPYSVIPPITKTLAIAVLAVLVPLSATPSSGSQSSVAGKENRSVVPAVSDGEIAEWSRYVELSEGSASKLSRERKSQELVILRSLADRLGKRADPAAREELDRRRERLAEELAERRIGLRLQALEVPTEAEIRAAFDSRRESLRHPRLWRLSDLFKAAPAGLTTEQRDALRKTMESFRARILAGESFADLARAESESSTRERGGAAGFVALDDLRPELARVVADLQPGGLSPVVALPHGFVLLQCGGIDPEKVANLADERVGISNSLRTDRVRARRARIDAEIDSLLAAQAPSSSSPPTSRSRLLDEEARRLGWAPDEDDRILVRYKEVEVRARLEADLELAERVAVPTSQEVSAAWESSPARWVEPRKRHLRALTLEIDRGGDAAIYERFLSDSRELSLAVSSEGALERLQARVAALGGIADLGWLTDDEVWALGRNADTAIHELVPGRVTPAVQEGRRLRVFELLGERPEHRKSLSEAAPDVQQALVSHRRRAAMETIRQEILAAATATAAPAGAPEVKLR